jgi:hypothetical protein
MRGPIPAQCTHSNVLPRAVGRLDASLRSSSHGARRGPGGGGGGEIASRCTPVARRQWVDATATTRGAQAGRGGQMRGRCPLATSLISPSRCVQAGGSGVVWRNAAIGGGGYATGIYVHPSSGDVYMRTDVGGAIKLNPTGSNDPADPWLWEPLWDWVLDNQEQVGARLHRRNRSSLNSHPPPWPPLTPPPTAERLPQWTATRSGRCPGRPVGSPTLPPTPPLPPGRQPHTRVRPPVVARGRGPGRRVCR